MVWVAEEIDKRAEYKTKLVKVEIEPWTNTYIFYVKKYKPVIERSK